MSDFFSPEEKKWIAPLKKVLKEHKVTCVYGSLALMCDIHNLYAGKKKNRPQMGWRQEL